MPRQFTWFDWLVGRLVWLWGRDLAGRPHVTDPTEWFTVMDGGWWVRQAAPSQEKFCLSSFAHPATLEMHLYVVASSINWKWIPRQGRYFYHYPELVQFFSLASASDWEYILWGGGVDCLAGIFPSSTGDVVVEGRGIIIYTNCNGS